MHTTATIIEALYYIHSKTGETDKLKLTRLIYLADKYHLIHYGRTITNDDYYVMEHEPVGTTAKDVLNPSEFNMLSETDREALDFVIEHFGEFPEYPECLKKDRERIDTRELLSCAEGDPLSMPEEHIRESEKILTGDFD